MAASMAVGVLTVLLSPEPVRRDAAAGDATPPSGCASVLVEPFADFIRRYRWQAALILALIAVYRISDVVMGIMANPFYVDMGFTKDEVATVSKIYGVVMTLVGAFVGGVLSMRFGVMRVLMLGAVLSAASNLLFAWLGSRGHDVHGAGAGGLGRQPVQRHRLGRLHRLPVEPDQRQLLGHAVRAVQLDDAAAAQVPRRLLGQVRRRLRLRQLLHGDGCLGVPVLLLVWLASRMKAPAARAADGQLQESIGRLLPRFARALQVHPAPSCSL